MRAQSRCIPYITQTLDPWYTLLVFLSEWWRKWWGYQDLLQTDRWPDKEDLFSRPPHNADESYHPDED